MAIFKHVFPLLLISLVLILLVQAEHQPVSTSSAGSKFVEKIDCGTACTTRCQLASRQKMCKRACGTCCDRCNCVPPGTSGNQEVCPCYYTMTTHGGRKKCP